MLTEFFEGWSYLVVLTLGEEERKALMDCATKKCHGTTSALQVLVVLRFKFWIDSLQHYVRTEIALLITFSATVLGAFCLD